MEKFIHVDRCDSTQDILKEQLSQNDAGDLTVSCEHQTLGRGRGENVWQDSPGTLCFSMTVKPSVKPSFTAIELSALVRKFFKQKGRDVLLKWPNDLMTPDQKKCGGILVQTHQSLSLAGIGLNLFNSSETFGGIYEASFELEKKSWAKELSQFIRSNRYTDTESLSREWLDGCYHQNCEVRVFEAENETIGKFIGLGPYGEALIENNQGIHHLFNGSLRLV